MDTIKKIKTVATIGAGLLPGLVNIACGENNPAGPSTKDNISIIKNEFGNIYDRAMREGKSCSGLEREQFINAGMARHYQSYAAANMDANCSPAPGCAKSTLDTFEAYCK